MTSLELRGVTRRYGAVTALEEVTLSVPAGSRTAIVGPSGCGKSTLLRIVAGFETPDTGQVTLDGVLMADGPRAVPAHRRGVGMVAQEGALFPHLTIAENIGFGIPRREAGRDARIEELASLVGLAPAMLPRKPDELSGGQQQRVALARALACRPRVMLLDEPFSALDTALRAGTRQTVAKLLSEAGITTVLVTHDQAEALSFADQVAVLREGRLLQAGPPRELYLRPRDALVARFFGEAVILPATLGEGVADGPLGRVPIAPGLRPGPAEIMLRPEQIAFSEDPHGAGEVVEVVFGGPACLVIVALGSGIRLVLTRPYLDLPAVGSRIAFAVQGEAHVMPG